ncbi:uncharacterized protein BCR38DRAFT_331082 [Pseudomassariella vexata]|uniref:C2H2-type domain-containing protein n=1 Tax=Pseudomassariella vexata TaxID=1141098 RepID=A0A1Y2EJJ7_9PEZI|nr:uncharacterized protein BCR38DRAFT_331082 [Pseudomassariella vexata]ORY71732.1 hypothetical protein BCR38DRAFT_331082 [Pseudomassariella vexata]
MRFCGRLHRSPCPGQDCCHNEKVSLMAQTQHQPNWGRWHGHHHPGPEYIIMDPSTIAQYDSITTTSIPLQRPSPTPQYMVGTAYSMSPITSVNAPQYHSENTFAFNSYTPPSPAPLTSPLRPYQEERPQPRLMPADHERIQGMAYSRGDRADYGSPVHTPPVKGKAQLSTTTKPSVKSETNTPGSAKDEVDEAVFHTDVDILLRRFQSKAGDKKTGSSQSGYQSPPNSHNGSRASSPAETKDDDEKPHICMWLNCDKAFKQKTHLDIHLRMHTGEKPYKCLWPDCNYRFSQRGNVKTHLRRHTGERPFPCHKCPKRFAQRGNLRAHLDTHEGRRKFYCFLDGCNKVFTQLGNLKVHINRFHKDTLRELLNKVDSLDIDEVPQKDHETLEKVAHMFRNSNKGIKGRGIGRKYTTPGQKNVSINISSLYPVQQPSPPMYHIPHHLHLLPNSAQHAVTHPGSVNHYNMPTEHHMTVGRESRTYGMFDAQDGLSTSSAASSSPETLYEEVQSRDLDFCDRVY